MAIAAVKTRESDSLAGARRQRSFSAPLPVWLPVLLTPVVLIVHGYHPFAGDAGIYVAGLRHLLDPSLYPVNSAFVAAFTHRSIFALAMAAVIRLAHLGLDWTLFLAHLLSIWLFLFACRQVALRLFERESQRACAVLLGAACFTLPVAGTALVLMDPYVTARSFSTPLSLLAIATCIDGAWFRTLLLLAFAVAIHPLMGAYACAFVFVLALIAARRIRVAVAVCVAAVAASAAAFVLAHGHPIDPTYRQAVLLAPHSFLFLARWHWYEDLGLFLPLLLFALAARGLKPADPRRLLCLTALLAGATAVLIAALFVPAAGPYPLVPFQILRSFHIVYAAGLVLAAGPVAMLFDRARVATAALLILLFAGMFLAEPLSWPACDRVEWPGRRVANPYAQAFVWIRAHTPRAAVFAFRPDLVYEPEEDEQGFRAIAERGQLADDKDAGIAVVVPALAARWAEQRNAELSIDAMTDQDRRATLLPLGATWILLPPQVSTGLRCPWKNSVLKVCRLTF